MKESEYTKLFLSEPALRNKPKIEMSNPSAYVDSMLHFGSQSNFSMAWRYIKEPMLFDRIPHKHKFDEFLCFLGANLEDMFDFDATIELSMGEECEVYLIEQATVVYIPSGLVHTPLTFKRIVKPVLFHPIALIPDYYSNFSNNVQFLSELRMARQVSSPNSTAVGARVSEKKYAKYFLTEPELRTKFAIPTMAPSALVEAKTHFGVDSNLSVAWRYITTPMVMDEIPHAHPGFDEYLVFLGGNLENMFDFDADIEISMGKEREIYKINKATVIYIPKGLFHCPINFKRIGKPVLFQPIPLTPAYYSMGEASKIR